MRDANDLLHGTLDVLVLKTLSWSPMHGYAIAKWIEDRTRDELTVVDAALYKSLHRLEEAGAVASEWGLSDNNRKAKFYKLTKAGRKQIERDTRQWEETNAIMTRFLAADGHE